jgi:hypothetical protein
MEHLASTELQTYVEPAEATAGSRVVGEGVGLGALLVMLMPFALAAWSAIGFAVYRVLT